MPKIWIDGQFLEKADAKVSVFDHGLLYGDGVFEGIRAYGGRVFRLRQHVDRLFASARAIMLSLPMTPEAVCDVVKEAVRINGLTDAYIRLVATRGVGDLGLDPRKCKKPTLICIADAISLWPQETYDRGLSMVTVPTPVNQPHNLSPQIKSLNYLAHIMAKVEAIYAQADEALMLEPSGYVAEGSGQNIFCVHGRTVRTPPAHAGILRGITRGAVIDSARAAGLEVIETPITRYDLYTADEVFLTGTAAEVVGIARLDGRPIGTGTVGPITKDVTARFRALTREES